MPPRAAVATRAHKASTKRSKTQDDSSPAPAKRAATRAASGTRKNAALRDEGSVNLPETAQKYRGGSDASDAILAGSDLDPVEQIQVLEGKATALSLERDALRQALDELRALRQTTAETNLESYKKAADVRYKHSQDLVASLKSRLDVAEARATSAQRQGHSSSPAFGINEGPEEAKKLRAQVEELKRDKRRAEESTTRLAQELRDATSARGSAPQMSKMRLTDADNAAVRRLYEDLTGIVISRIDAVKQIAQGRQGVELEQRRFTGVFAASGHYDMQLTFEECPPDDEAPSRQDLVYVPHIDEHRDRALLQESKIPDYLCEELPFDRRNGVAFLTTLTKALKR